MIINFLDHVDELAGKALREFLESRNSSQSQAKESFKKLTTSLDNLNDNVIVR